MERKGTPIFQGFRSDKGEEMILDRNMFVERVLPGSVLRKLAEAEMTEYRRPFLKREDRWPTLTWPRQIPIARRAGRCRADRGGIRAMDGRKRRSETVHQRRARRDPDRRCREFCRGWNNQTEVTVPGGHFVQEDSGPAIGQAVADWMKAHADLKANCEVARRSQIRQPPAKRMQGPRNTTGAGG